MTRDLGESKINRRKFLRGLSAAGGLAVVAGTAGEAQAAQPAQPSTAPQRQETYRVTAHVAKYYDKARF
jgi:secreted PhoX family phosphatase